MSWKILQRDAWRCRAAAETIVRRMVAGIIAKEKTDGTDTGLNWSGGGNLPPGLGIARVLCRPRPQPALCQAARDGAAGPDRRLSRHRDHRRLRPGRALSARAFHDAERVLSHLATPSKRRSRLYVAAEAPDVVLIDAMFPRRSIRRGTSRNRPRCSCTPSCSASSTCREGSSASSTACASRRASPAID